MTLRWIIFSSPKYRGEKKIVMAKSDTIKIIAYSNQKGRNQEKPHPFSVHTRTKVFAIEK